LQLKSFNHREKLKPNRTKCWSDFVFCIDVAMPLIEQLVIGGQTVAGRAGHRWETTPGNIKQNFGQYQTNEPSSFYPKN